MTTSAPLIRKAVQERLKKNVEGSVTTEWDYIAEAGSQVADLLQFEFWAHLNPAPQPWDIITAREELGAWRMQLVVRSTTDDGILVSGVLATELESVAPRDFQPTNLEGCRLAYAGPFLKWRVERPDGSTLRAGFDDEKRAAQWLTDYLRVARARAK